jgi:hypothetical protein
MAVDGFYIEGFWCTQLFSNGLWAEADVHMSALFTDPPSGSTRPKTTTHISGFLTIRYKRHCHLGWFGKSIAVQKNLMNPLKALLIVVVVISALSHAEAYTITRLQKHLQA